MNTNVNRISPHIESAFIPKILEQLSPENVEETLRKIDDDPFLVKTSYYLSRGGEATEVSNTYVYELVIANASKELHTPKEQHQLLAKGIVYTRYFKGPENETTERKLVSLPFTKFYNSFEGVAVNDVAKLGTAYTKVLTRKYDGTMISRFVFEGVIYWATRGKILNFERNKYWDLLQNVLTYDQRIWQDDLLKSTECGEDCTLIFELIGPDNPHVEFHIKNELVQIGLYDKIHNKFLNHTERVDIYKGDSPEEVIKSWSKVQEGLVVNYVGAYNEVVYRVKFKTDAYLSLMHAKNSASPATLFILAVENTLNCWQDVDNYLRSYLATSPYFEELLEYYKGVWNEKCMHSRLDDLATEVYQITIIEEKLKDLESRKEKFLKAKELLKDNAGLAMSYIDGKITTEKIKERLAEKYLKELKNV